MINLLSKDHVSGGLWFEFYGNKTSFGKGISGKNEFEALTNSDWGVGIPSARSTCVHVTNLLKWTKEITLNLVGKLKNFSVVFFCNTKIFKQG